MPFPHMYDLNDPKITRQIAQDVDRDFEIKSFWTCMSGSDSRFPIFTKYQTQVGDFTRKFLNSLTGDGVRGNADFDTKEDKLSYLSMSISQDIFGNSTTSDDDRVEKHVHGNSFTRDAVGALSDWRRRCFDRKIFASLSHNCTNIAAFGFGTKTGLYTINQGQSTQDLCKQIQNVDKFTLRGLRSALYNARMGIDHKQQRHPRVRPYRIYTKNNEGVSVTQNLYIALLHPMQLAALEDDPDYVMVQAHANERGVSNPLISGQVGIIDGCIIVNAGEWSDELKEAGILTSDVADIEGELNKREIVDRGITQMNVYAGDGGQLTACGLLIGGTSLLLSSDFKSQVRMGKTDLDRKIRVGLDVFFGMRKTHYTGYTEEEKKSLYHGKDFSCMALVSAI